MRQPKQLRRWMPIFIGMTVLGSFMTSGVWYDDSAVMAKHAACLNFKES